MRFALPRLSLAIFALLPCIILVDGFVTAGEAEAARTRAAPEYNPPRSAIVADGHTGRILHSSKADEPRYPASLTKVMTLYLVFEFLRAKRIDLATEMAVTANAASQPPTKLYLKEGETISVHNAMRALVTRSANDAAVVIAENLAGSEDAFARLMTLRARMLGMKNTTFRNASGLPDSNQKTTAYDMLVMARAVLRDFPEHASLFRTKYFRYGKRLYKNHNALLFTYAGVEGMKTGFTIASGFNLIATAKRDDKRLIAVVMGGRSGKHRNDLMRALLDAAWSRATPEAKAMAARAEPVQRTVRKAAPQETAALAGIASAPVRSLAQPALAPERTERTASTAQTGPAEDVRPTLRIAAAQPERDGVIATNLFLKKAVGVEAAEARRSAEYPGPYHIQVGAYESLESANLRLDAVGKAAADILRGRQTFVMTSTSGGRQIVRARFGGFSRSEAEATCEALKLRAIDCLVMQFDGSGS